MTPLRQRFIQDLQLRNRSPKTIEAYVFHVRNFARFFNTAPDQFNGERQWSWNTSLAVRR